MSTNRATSDNFHVRSSSGVTLEWTPDEAAARKVLREESAAGASLWQVNPAGEAWQVG